MTSIRILSLAAATALTAFGAQAAQVVGLAGDKTASGQLAVSDLDAGQSGFQAVAAEDLAGRGTVPVDDVILGEGLYGGGVIARHAAITAGLTTVPGASVNRHCAAGQAAVQNAAAGIRAGMDRLVVAGGVNSV